MKKIKLSIGILAFVGLAVLNFTKSETTFVQKAMASSACCSSCNSSCTCGCMSSSITSSDDPNYAYAAKLTSENCPIEKINGNVEIVIRGVTIAPGAAYVINGTRLQCTFYLLAKCDQRDVTLCQEAK